MALRITYGPWGESLSELHQAARDAEAAGAAVVWFPEMYRSATVTAATAAQATATVGIGTAVALAFVRSPLTTALEALDIDEASGGRLHLGLGSGVRRLNQDWHNVSWGRPVAHLSQTVDIIRAVAARSRSGEPITCDGDRERVDIRGYRRPFRQARDSFPIYIGGVGPAMTALAGRTGDGYLSHELCSRAWTRDRIRPALRAGLEAADRDPASLDIVLSACCSISGDLAEARRWSAGLVGFYASVRTYADFFAFHGFESDQARVLAAFAAGASADDLGDHVSDRMVDALTLSGTFDDVRARLRDYDGLATTMKLTPPTHGLSAEETRQAQRRLIDLIASLTERRPL